jgi:hypothetical protein
MALLYPHELNPMKSQEIPWNPKCWWSNHHQWMALFGCKSQCVLLLLLARAQPKRHQETIGSMGPGSQANDASGPGAGWLWRWFMWEDHGVIFGGSLLWGTGGAYHLANANHVAWYDCHSTCSKRDDVMFFFPFMLYTFYMFVEDTLRLSWADQNQDWLRFTWWLDCCMLLLRSLWGKALWFWHRQSFNYWGGLTGRPSGSASPWTYVPPVYCPHCALVTLHMAALLHMTKKQ